MTSSTTITLRASRVQPTDEQILAAIRSTAFLRDVKAGRRFEAASILDFDGPLGQRLKEYVDALPGVDALLRDRRDREPERFWFKELYNPPAYESREVLRGADGLALFGPVGTGKTHAAIGVLHWALLKGHTADFLSTVELTSKLRASFRDGSESADDIIDDLAKVPLLCLDDIDKVSGTAFVCEQFFDLIDARYRAALPIVITSNCGPSGIAAAFAKLPTCGEAIVDRLREMIPNANWLQLRGKSRRIAA